jgi:hypothetical protein
LISTNQIMAFSTSALVLFVGLVFTYSIFKLSPLENGISKDPEIRWNWDEIDLSAESIAKRIKDHTSNFVFGTATAAHQVIS